MKPRQLEALKKRLVDELTALYRTVHGEVRDSMGTLWSDMGRDEVDESQKLQWRDLGLSLAESDARRAQLIEAALHRIRDGAFGECVDCGGEIGDARLKLVPWTPRCLECQEAVEREERGRPPTL